ncbi:hypothetical protein ABPG77_010517 [Micractinium sp. CCAP 211/92]
MKEHRSCSTGRGQGPRRGESVGEPDEERGRVLPEEPEDSLKGPAMPRPGAAPRGAGIPEASESHAGAASAAGQPVLPGAGGQAGTPPGSTPADLPGRDVPITAADLEAFGQRLFTFIKEEVEPIKKQLNDVDKRTAKLDERTAKLDKRTAKLDEWTAKLDKLDKRTAKLDKRTAKLAEHALGAHPCQYTSARGLVERLASGGPFSPDYGALVDVLVEGGSGFRALLKLVHKRLQKEYPAVSLVVPGGRDPWPAQLAAVQQMKAALVRHQATGKQPGKTWWWPFMELLVAYAQTAAEGGTAGLRSYFLAGGEAADRLSLALLVALTGGELRNSLKVDDTPRLELQADNRLALLLREIKASGAAAKAARKQLALAARALVVAVHAADATLLATYGPLAVYGTIAVFEEGDKAEALEGTTVDVGRPSRAKSSVLPSTEGTIMRISVQAFSR